MITTTLLAVLGTLLVIVLMQLFKKTPEPPARSAPAEDLANLKPSDARAGDVISVSGAGDNMTDLDFTADRTTWFDAGSRHWFEIGGPYHERRVSLRVSNQEEVETSIHSAPRKLTLEDVGLSEEDLAEMDERQNTADRFEFDGKTWMYRLSREAQGRRSDLPQPDSFYYWEFQEQNGTGLLAIRKAEAEPFAVTLYTEVPAGNVTVYRGGRS